VLRRRLTDDMIAQCATSGPSRRFNYLMSTSRTGDLAATLLIVTAYGHSVPGSPQAAGED